MSKPEYDFSGWATRNDILCSDGRTIRRNAFKHNDGKTVPLVWNHSHNDPDNIIGHALLENRDEGVYAYGFFNHTDRGMHAKELVQHGDITALSIYANQLRQNDRKDVLHGDIKELSLVLAGANIGAYIDTVIEHGEEIEEAGVIYTGEEIELYHADDREETEEVANEHTIEHAEGSEKTVKDVIESMTDEQKNVLYYVVGTALEDANAKKEGDDNVKHNIFETEMDEETTLSHDEMQTIIKDGKRMGSLKDSFLEHAQDYGISNLEMLFPEVHELNNTPEFIKRDTGWVSKVMSGVHKTPFSKLKSTYADITGDEARAKGYIKGKLKKEEVFSLLKRTTQPTTIYKKQKMDRDDVIDITDFDVISWIKGEMRLMLDEEIARAILIGDGRLASDDDHIDTNCIRPVFSDADLYNIKATVAVKQTATEDEIAKEFIKQCIKTRKEYKGSGNPTLYTTEDMLTSMLLLTDMNGRDLYESEAKLATKLRVKEIVTVEPMEGLTDASGNAVMAIMVNLNDYFVGADKGGAINMFDDFDIDFNQMKYLIETRCSGSLMKPYSAVTFSLSKTL